MADDLPCTAVPDRIGTPILGICNQIEKEMTLKESSLFMQINYVLNLSCCHKCIITSVSKKNGDSFVTVKRP